MTMKKWVVIFILSVCGLSASANNFTFGTPFGSASLTSMVGRTMGDTGYIAPGSYTFFRLQNCDSLVILPLDPNNLPVFTNTSTVSLNRWCEIAYLQFVWGSGSGICWQMNGGKDYHNNYHNLYCYGWSSTVFTKHNNILYTPGDTSTLISYKDIWHDIIIDSCGQFMQGSFGNPASNSWNPPDVFGATTVYNIQDIATSLQGGNGQGTGIRGVFFELTVHDVRITDRSGRGADGDLGWVYLTGGSVHMWNVVKWGGPAYVLRNNDPMQEYGHPWDNEISNCAKFNGTQYGLINIQAVLNDTLAGKFYGPTDYLWNLTLGNQLNDTLGYWSTAINLGQIAFNSHHWTWNILTFNIGNNIQRVAAGGQPNNGKNQLWVNLGGWGTINVDTLNGIYYKYGTLINIDSTSIMYTNRIGSFPYYRPTLISPGTVVHGGIVGPKVNPFPDLGGSLPRSLPDKGYLQLMSGIAPCNCHIRNKWTKTLVK